MGQKSYNELTKLKKTELKRVKTLSNFDLLEEVINKHGDNAKNSSNKLQVFYWMVEYGIMYAELGMRLHDWLGDDSRILTIEYVDKIIHLSLDWTETEK